MPEIGLLYVVMYRYLPTQIRTMATARQLLFIWVAIYSQIRLYMQNILI